MNKLHISQNQFSDLINLLNNVFYPLKNFVTKEEFLKIIYKKRFKKKFFPLPIYFGLTRETYFKYKKNNNLNLNYKKKYLLNISNIKFYNLDKKKYVKKFMEIIILIILTLVDL